MRPGNSDNVRRISKNFFIKSRIFLPNLLFPHLLFTFMIYLGVLASKNLVNSPVLIFIYFVFKFLYQQNLITFHTLSTGLSRKLNNSKHFLYSHTHSSSSCSSQIKSNAKLQIVSSFSSCISNILSPRPMSISKLRNKVVFIYQLVVSLYIILMPIERFQLSSSIRSNSMMFKIGGSNLESTYYSYTLWRACFVRRGYQLISFFFGEDQFMIQFTIPRRSEQFSKSSIYWNIFIACTRYYRSAIISFSPKILKIFLMYFFKIALPSQNRSGMLLLIHISNILAQRDTPFGHLIFPSTTRKHIVWMLFGKKLWQFFMFGRQNKIYSRIYDIRGRVCMFFLGFWIKLGLICLLRKLEINVDILKSIEERIQLRCFFIQKTVLVSVNLTSWQQSWGSETIMLSKQKAWYRIFSQYSLSVARFDPENLEDRKSIIFSRIEIKQTYLIVSILFQGYSQSMC